MDPLTDRALQAVIGFRVETIELCGFVRLTLADRNASSPVAPDDSPPRTVYRIPIESAFHVLGDGTDTLVCFQPWTDAPATGLNELGDLFRATIDEAAGVKYRSLTLKLTTQYSQKRILRIDDDSSGYEAWHLEKLS
jgi:hypothetical protein